METGYVIMLDQQTLIQVAIQLINTIILCFVLSKLLYKPVLKFLEARKARVADELDSADKKLKEADNLKQVYENKLASIEQERNEILENARISALKNSQQILAEAKKDAETLRKRAEKDIQREQEKAKDEIKKQIIEVSTMVSSKFVAAKINQDEQMQLIDDTISDLEEVKWLS